MAITFSCESCTKTYTVRDDFAGKTGQCKQCGHRMIIPLESDSDGYGLDVEPSRTNRFDESDDAPAPLPPRIGSPTPQPLPARRPLFDRSESSSSSGGGTFASLRNGIGGSLGVLIFVVIFGLRMYFRWDRVQNRNRNNPNNQANALAPLGGGGPNFGPPLVLNPNAPIVFPRFPQPGPGREIEPGILLHEVVLGPARPPLNTLPGHSGKLWLYLPSGDHPARSLPCILITGAGSTLLTGMGLGDGDRAEHLPYVRAGFAVLAFELDGHPPEQGDTSKQTENESIIRFLASRAGLVNAKIALEYALKMVPEVDPARISVAGHSSAATLALLFAANEPRLKACVAFAPAIDLEARFGPENVAQFRRAGIGDLAVRYSPRTNENKINCPLFLFSAQDDTNTRVIDSQAFANRLKSQGKSVTFDVVPTGGHYESMIDPGIAHAIAWLGEQGAGP